MELIDRNALGIVRCNPEVMIDRAYAAGWNGVIGIIERAAVVDAVPVVRCGECKHWANGMTEKRSCHKTDAYPMTATDFCSYGEPRTPPAE